MEPNNIENQIREKLNSREIKPTEMAWDRLDAMLSVAEEKKTKRFAFFNFKNIGIAASIILFVSLGLFFFNKNETIVPENDVVVKENINNNINDNSNTKNSEIVHKQENQVAEATQNSQIKTRNPQLATRNPKSSPSFNSINQKSNQQSIINKEKAIEYQVSEVIAQKDMPKITSQEKIEMPNRVSVNADDLLASVEKSSKPQKINAIKVNANSLLSQVDGELEQTFRQKVINRISKNYQEVKVALANRNQE